MRPRVPREEDFTSGLRGPGVTARVGLWLGVCFAVAFLTGLVSHWAQVPDPAIPFPTRPVWGYRVTQGLHVAAGTAAVPLLLVKLWSVYPKLFVRPPWASLRRLAGHLAERASIGVLVAAALFQVASGLANSAQWYPWAFSFRPTHYAGAWLAVGALVLHIAVKLPVVRAALGTALDSEPTGASPPGPGLSRRGLLRSAGLASVVAVVATAGSTVPLLRRVSVLGVRSGDGPGGVPINKSALAAGVTESARAASYRLAVVYDGREVRLSRSDLEALPQATESLPIACVEGWSAQGTWTGVRMRDLLDLVEAPRGRALRVESLQQAGAFRATTLPAQFADDPVTLLALSLDGQRLSLDHGYPARVIAPDRPGVLQTKWVTRIEVLP